MDHINLRYEPPGPVSAAFMASRGPVRLLNGPIGSGKTTACLMDVTIGKGLLQPPSRLDGRRRMKTIVTRDSNVELGRTTVKSWHKRFPPELGKWVGGDKGPWTHEITFTLSSDFVLELIVDFRGVNDTSVEDFTRGLEVTAAYVNEADLQPGALLGALLGRVGRYPDKDIHGEPAWRGVVLDCNAPDPDSWVYQDFFETPRDGYELFRQPGGREPGAENLANLPSGYYELAANGQKPHYVRRMIDNRVGYSLDGRPVFEEDFNDAVHVAPRELEPTHGRGLVLGADAGLTPAAVIWQPQANGQWLALDEITTDRAGPQRFARELRRLLRERYAGLPVLGAWADPSSDDGADKGDGALSWLEIVAAEAELRFMPAPTNRLIPRLEAWRQPMGRMIDGRHPGLLISPRCRVLRRALVSSYRYKRLVVGGGLERFADAPEKLHPWSDVVDAGGYGLLGGGEYQIVMGRERGRQQATPAARLAARRAADYDPHEALV